MSLILLLFVIGLLMVAAEIFVPGGILGIGGSLLMLAGSILSFMRFGMGGGLLALTAMATIVGVAIWIALKVLPRTRIGKRAFLTAQVTAVSSSKANETKDLIGKSAEALTMLSPTGYVRIEGRRYEAFCQAGQVPAGSALEVIGADNFRLIVTKR